jgi:hypothetical protein
MVFPSSGGILKMNVKGTPMELFDYIGNNITVVIPAIDPDSPQIVKLLGVEPGGIWIESQTLIDHILKIAEQKAAPNSLAFFFPYHELRFAFVPIEGPALSEKALLE